MRLSFALILITFIAFPIAAQDSYAVTLKGDTLAGDIYIQSSDFYDEVDIKSEKKREKLKSYQVKIVKLRDDFFRPIAYKNKKVFAKIVEEGPKVGFYMVKPDGQNDYNENILIKKDGQQMPMGLLGFRNRASNFFEDCESITTKLDEKELGFNDLQEIVRMYNANCGENAVDVASETSIDDFAELTSAMEVLSDVLKKVKAGETVSTYQLDILRKNTELDLNAELKKLLEAANQSGKN